MLGSNPTALVIRADVVRIDGAGDHHAYDDEEIWTRAWAAVEPMTAGTSSLAYMLGR